MVKATGVQHRFGQMGKLPYLKDLCIESDDIVNICVYFYKTNEYREVELIGRDENA